VAAYAFYHLLQMPLEQALPRLMERALAAGHRAVILAASVERVASLDTALWTWDAGSFLPHAAAPDDPGAPPDPDAHRQPIWLSTRPGNPNGATVLVLVDGVAATDLEGFQRCLDLFDGTDDAAVAAARDRWRSAKAAGHEVTYWAQSPEGRWEQRA
jgi:DNA polymerase-3 subunit chi